MRVKIVKHGVFFKNGCLKTECKCGCVYLTHKKYVDMHERTVFSSYGESIAYLRTTCPECGHKNDQYIKDLEKQMDGKA